MKKILVINSSTRENGNCDLLCTEFIRGASANPENSIARVDLKDKNFDFYRENQAEDDADILAQQMRDSNVIVMATPVYFYTMSGMMKSFIDRMTPYFSGFDGQDFYFFLTAPLNRSEMEAAADSLNGFTDSVPNSRVVRVVYASNVLHKGDVVSHPAYREVFEIGQMIE